MRTCLRCKKQMTKDPKEASHRWLARKFCSQSCARMKLSPEAVRAIRSSPKLLRELAAEYSMSITTIAGIKARKTWAWLED